MKHAFTVLLAIAIIQTSAAQDMASTYARLERTGTCSIDTTQKNYIYAYYRYLIEGYADKSSYAPGETIHLFLGKGRDTSLSDMSVRIIRYGGYGWDTSHVYNNENIPTVTLQYHPFRWVNEGGVTKTIDHTSG